MVKHALKGECLPTYINTSDTASSTTNLDMDLLDNGCKLVKLNYFFFTKVQSGVVGYLFT
ncbi:MAG: hypothetical protein K9J17_12625 [Flavobacteriales bacterium]|nr:hypothetical protein [Flavobacteriales bacterium]